MFEIRRKASVINHNTTFVTITETFTAKLLYQFAIAKNKINSSTTFTKNLKISINATNLKLVNQENVTHYENIWRNA